MSFAFDARETYELSVAYSARDDYVENKAVNVA
jgi:hypothetical protein